MSALKAGLDGSDVASDSSNVMHGGHVAPDGSPVAVYLAIPAGDAPTVIHDAVDPGADILELGSGVGRLTRVLVAYGHEVVAVDDGPAMLEHVTGAETVCADLYQLDLGRRFGAVIAASHLVNSGGAAGRARLLDVCARHVAADGVVLVERYPLEWSANPTDTAGTVGPVETSVTIRERRPDGFSATAEYRLAQRVWRQEFDGEPVDDDTLAEAAGQANLRLTDWLDDARTWARLRPAT